MGQCTGTITTLNPDGSPEAGVILTFRAKAVANAGSGIALSTAEFDSDASDVDGLIETLFPSGGFFYEGRRGSGEWVEFRTAITDDDTFAIPYTIGSP